MTTADSGPADLVVLSLEAWDAVWRRNQYLIAGLLRTHPALRVLFVEPSADPLYAIRQRRRPHRGAGLRTLQIDGVTSGRLWLHQRTKWLPRRVDRTADVRRARSVLRAARRIGFADPVLWFNDPDSAPLLLLTDAPALYDVTDDWLSAHRTPAEHARIARNERSLLEQCGEVTVCSAALARSKGASRAVTLITNGVDLDRYRAPTTRPADLPEGRTAVYVGTLHSDRLDVALCARTASALAGAGSVVMVGPNALTDEESAVLRRAGVVLLGARAHHQIPGYLQHADVLLVPHVVDAFTDSLDPIKLYEYRAVGRPVVATPVAGFRESNDPAVTAVPAAEFPSQVRRALTTPPPAVSTGPRSANIPTWDQQSAAMWAALCRAAAAGTRPSSRG